MLLTVSEDKIAQCLSRLLRTCSYEISSRDVTSKQTLHDNVEPGSSIFISFVPGSSYHASVQLASIVRRSGYIPVPHVAARHLDTYTQLGDFLARLSGEAGVTQALLVAGDMDPSRGPFQSSLELLKTGLLQKHGIRSIGIAGYPEGHRKVVQIELERALKEKLRLGTAAGLDMWITTQFCFEVAPIVDWIGNLRAEKVGIPVRIGLAGPASVTTLLNYALNCGIGNSLKAISTRPDSILRTLGEANPDKIAHGLAAATLNDEHLGDVNLHFFTFGGVARTSKWIKKVLARLDSQT